MPSAASTSRTPDDTTFDAAEVEDRDEDRLFWDARIARRAWAMRGHPGSDHKGDSELRPCGVPAPDEDRAWKDALAAPWMSGRGGPSVADAYRAAAAPDRAQALALLAATSWQVLDALAARHGPSAALDLLGDYPIEPHLQANAHIPYQLTQPLGPLRTRIAMLDDDDYATCAQWGRHLASSASTAVTVAAAFLFPTEDWARDLADAHPGVVELRPTASAPPAAASLPRFGVWRTHPGSGSVAATLLGRFGLDAAPALLTAPAEGADDRREQALVAARIGTDAAFETLVDSLDDRHAQAAIADACRFQPHRAVRILSAVKGRRAEVARVRLVELAAEHPGLVERMAPGLGAAQRVVLEGVMATGERRTASPDRLPPVLADPPWRRKQRRAARPVLDDLSIADTSGAISSELGWDDAERRKAAAATTYDEFTQAEQLPQAVARVQEMLAAAQAAVAQGATPRWQWESPVYLEQQLAELQARLAAYRPPGREVALDWIATGRMRPTQVLRTPADLAGDALACEPDNGGWSDDAALLKVLALHGLEAERYVAAAIQRAPAANLRRFPMLGSSLLGPAVAKAMTLKSARGDAERWMLRFPAQAAAGLIPVALSKPSKDRDGAERGLRILARAGHRSTVVDLAATAGPEVAAAIGTVLDLDPRTILPSRIPAPPTWMVPAALAPVELADGSGALDADAVDNLVTMLAFSPPDDPYAGIDDVQQACTAESLARFAWSLFQQWVGAGHPSAGSWALGSLGLLGDDQVARDLAALVRVWPGEGGHARAVAGLDVLARLGTDTSLLQLNGIANSAKFKGLRTKAAERIAEIADARGLTREELEDRLVPDLGLDPDGSLWLDFGASSASGAPTPPRSSASGAPTPPRSSASGAPTPPRSSASGAPTPGGRQFRVGFDEMLVPFVRDEAGARLRALPKPNKQDDADLASAATARWKGLRKDAAAAAKLHLRRVEQAMVSRRRWDAATFTALFVEHPLVFHLTRRLVWGTYDGDTLTATFRVAEDRTLADIADDDWNLPDDATVGIPHVLELDGADAGAWGRIFADYELLQPFAQLGRPTFALDPAERDATELHRLDGERFHFGRIVALEHRGWRKGPVEDGGSVLEMLKATPTGQWIHLQLEQGLWMGALTDTPEQRVERVVLHDTDGWADPESRLSFGTLDAITASELLADLEAMRS
ncbi:MAG: DUF4132 domain-containing protein [Acidimicrobiia bacterium]|nr:DUF4132 domain-containing protein [Acidimicrobiia bacterium]